jgi:hypothetical protein
LAVPSRVTPDQWKTDLAAARAMASDLLTEARSESEVRRLVENNREQAFTEQRALRFLTTLATTRIASWDARVKGIDDAAVRNLPIISISYSNGSIASASVSTDRDGAPV